MVSLSETHRQDIKTYGIPATQIATDIGNVRAANTVMLGFWAAFSEAVSEAAMRQSVSDSVPPKTLDANLNAFDSGFKKGREILEQTGDDQR